ncbi:stage II sporulation protein R [Gorillibacterium sp. sgz5001074]|uniref:stage II sporulation protein R n=1 Tax=Gorillibacterium sp. sgz5001074 TaxID=3446695 RepID=UPI003F67D72A
MVKRVSYSSYIYLFFALIVLLVSWEHNRTMAAVVESDIPEESIRLRILANSDSVTDQALKRRVRDAIVEQMNTWVSGPTTLEEARLLVSERIPELEAIVTREIESAGFTYSSKVELGLVPFPAKMYGDKVYPAGDYEALRVTIGEGAGQNWWCVLFPPLCFVEAAKGEAVMKDKQETQDGKTGKTEPTAKSGKSEQSPKNDAKSDKNVKSDKNDKSDKEKTAVKAASASTVKKEVSAAAGDTPEQPKKEVKFFFWELMKSWFA